MTGHIFTFNFNKNNSACLKCFYQDQPSDEILNCDQEGILGTTASLVGSLQANEILKIIIGSKNILDNSILILNTINLKFRIVKFKNKKVHMRILIYIIFYFFFVFQIQISFAEEFVMLKNSKVNVRYGPSFEYPIKYMYLKKNLPVR